MVHTNKFLTNTHIFSITITKSHAFLVKRGLVIWCVTQLDVIMSPHLNDSVIPHAFVGYSQLLGLAVLQPNTIDLQ